MVLFYYYFNILLVSLFWRYQAVFGSVCLDGWSRHVSACWKLFTGVKKYSDAQDVCQMYDSNLVVVRSAQEVDVVRNLLDQSSIGIAWIELYNEENVDATKNKGYMHTTTSTCGVIERNKTQWQMSDCSKQMPFICKQEDFYFDKPLQKRICTNCKRRSKRFSVLPPILKKDKNGKLHRPLYLGSPTKGKGDAIVFQNSNEFQNNLKKFQNIYWFSQVLDRNRPIKTFGVDLDLEQERILCPHKGDFISQTSCYHFEETKKKTWDKAEKECQTAYNGSLVALNNWLEYAFVLSKLEFSKKPQFWIGIRQNQATWSNNQTILYPKWWDLMLPQGEKEKCGSSLQTPNKDEHWHWEDCNKILSFICEYKPHKEIPVAPPSEVYRFCPPLWVHHIHHSENLNTSCYRAFSEPRTWTEAVKHCDMMGARLFYFDNIEEQELLRKPWTLISEIYDEFNFEQFWVNLYLEMDMQSFRTAEGEDPLFLDIQSHYPKPASYRYCFVAEVSTLKAWNNMCEARLPYICEAAPGDNIIDDYPLPKTQELSACPYNGKEHWYYFNKACYRYVGGKVSYWGAMDNCNRMGGDLASIHSFEENYWILDMVLEEEVLEVSGNDFWIGGRDITEPGGLTSGYHWSDGTVFDWFNWWDGEPNNYQDQEHCVTFYARNSGYWNDDNCSTKKAYLCKMTLHHNRTATSQTPPTSPSNSKYISCSKGWWPMGDRCIKFFSRKSNFEEARQSCKNNHTQGELISIRSQEEQDILTAVIGLHQSDYYYIGLKENYGFQWLDQSPFSFANWNQGEPNGPSTDSDNEECVEIIPGLFGKWNDIPCGISRSYICQRPKDSEKKQELQYNKCSGKYSSFMNYREGCYKLVEKPASWKDARKVCQKMGVDLANIEDMYQQTYLKYFYGFSTNEPIWIGLKSEKGSGEFRWSDGWPMLFSHWGKLQPIGSTKSDRCVTYSLPSGYWKVDNCTSTRKFICGQMSVSMPTVDPPIDMKCPQKQGWFDFGGSYCYYISNLEKQTWNGALGRCHNLRGTLASIHSEEEMALLVRATKQIQGDIWIGLSQLTDLVFGWVDGSPMDFTHWSYNEPNSQDERCVELVGQERKWNDIHCLVTRSFICKVAKDRVQEADDQHDPFLLPTDKNNTKPDYKDATKPPNRVPTTKPTGQVNQDKQKNQVTTQKNKGNQADQSIEDIINSFPTIEPEDDSKIYHTPPRHEKLTGMSRGGIAGVVIFVIAAATAIVVVSFTYIRTRRGRNSGLPYTRAISMERLSAADRLETSRIYQSEDDY